MIVGRIQKIMAHYQLSPTLLADSIGVPRATISHIISGRNKPSLDFVLKLVKTYPEVNLYWLLNGKGSFPYEEEQKPFTEPKISEALPPAGKKIHKVLFIYEDGTFDEFEPKK